MSYIGRNIENLASRTKLDSISTSATATFNLLLNNVAYVPSSAESLTVSLNGIIQAPQSSYTVSGSTIIFASSLQSSDVINFILAERAITLTTIGSGTVTTSNIVDANVTTAKIADNAVTSAKLASGLALGKIGQVVQTYIDSIGFETNSSTPVQLTGVTANITPSSTSSKILVIGKVMAGAEVDYKMFFQLRNGTTLIGNSASAGNREISIGLSLNVQVNMPMTHNFQYLHSPSSTNQQTYNVYGHAEGSGTLKLNRGSTDSDAGTVGRGTTSLILMEVLA